MQFCQSYSISDKGLHRDNNEDCFLSAPQQGLWAVADGMGGHEAGEVASAIVVATLQQQSDRGAPLAEAVGQCHRAVLQAASEGQGATGMGSTVVALSSQDDEYEVCWVGDSRAYLWSPAADSGELRQLTTDHSYVQMLLASGAISATEVTGHPDKHLITQCIGSAELSQVKVDSCRGNWSRGQWILLCSDGLSDELDNTAIAQILCDASDPDSAGRALLSSALRAGGRDNITLQLIQSPVAVTPACWHQRLPKVSGNQWFDLGLYSLALFSALFIAVWTLF